MVLSCFALKGKMSNSFSFLKIIAQVFELPSYIDDVMTGSVLLIGCSMDSGCNCLRFMCTCYRLQMLIRTVRHADL